MNRVTLIGRTTKEPEIRYSQGAEPMCIAKFSLAVDRRIKKEGEQNADFINCVAFKKTAEFIEKYIGKGTKIAVAGHLQSGSYKHKDGYTVYTTDVIVDEIEFAESKKKDDEDPGRSPAKDTDGFVPIPDDIAESLPFK